MTIPHPPPDHTSYSASSSSLGSPVPGDSISSIAACVSSCQPRAAKVAEPPMAGPCRDGTHLDEPIWQDETAGKLYRLTERLDLLLVRHADHRAVRREQRAGAARWIAGC